MCMLVQKKNGDVETADKVFCVDYFNSEISVISIIKKKLVKCISHFKLNGSGKHPVKQAYNHILHM